MCSKKWGEKRPTPHSPVSVYDRSSQKQVVGLKAAQAFSNLAFTRRSLKPEPRTSTPQVMSPSGKIWYILDIVSKSVMCILHSLKNVSYTELMLIPYFWPWEFRSGNNGKVLPRGVLRGTLWARGVDVSAARSECANPQKPKSYG